MVQWGYVPVVLLLSMNQLREEKCSMVTVTYSRQSVLTLMSADREI